MEQLALMDEQYVTDLFAAMKREAHRERAYNRFMKCGAGLMALLFLGHLYLRKHHNDTEGPMMVMQALNLGILLFRSRLNSEARKKAMIRLTMLDDLRAVGPLADALAFQNSDMTGQVEIALTSLLPRLRAGDASLLNTQQRTNLHKALSGKKRGLYFRLAILKALEQVGDSRDIAAVEQLAGRKSRAENAVVSDAAAECLPYLRANIEREAVSRTLLRASEALSTLPAALLRPAQGPSTTPPELLLRISNHDGQPKIP